MTNAATGPACPIYCVIYTHTHVRMRACDTVSLLLLHVRNCGAQHVGAAVESGKESRRGARERESEKEQGNQERACGLKIDLTKRGKKAKQPKCVGVEEEARECERLGAVGEAEK